MNGSAQVDVDGKHLKLSNLEKVLYPAVPLSKRHVIDYYTRIAPALLPHLRGRPLTLKRYPDGVDGEFFYEKNCPSHRPSWVRTAPISNEDITNYCVCDDLATLVWVANLASLELHTSLSRASHVQQPTMLVFDLDPGEPAGIVDCARLGINLRDILEQLGLRSFAKTSGSKGLQVYVPLNVAVTYEQTKPFAHAVARLLEARDYHKVVSKMRKDLRPGKVFVDWSQNDDHKTTVCAYSLRARTRPTVSTPVTWEEVEEASETGDAHLLSFEAEAVLKRIERMGDLFSPVLQIKQGLPALKERTAAS